MSSGRGQHSWGLLLGAVAFVAGSYLAVLYYQNGRLPPLRFFLWLGGILGAFALLVAAIDHLVRRRRSRRTGHEETEAPP